MNKTKKRAKSRVIERLMTDEFVKELFFQNLITGNDLSKASRMGRLEGLKYLFHISSNREESGLSWPYPLIPEYKIKNIKFYRDAMNVSLGDAKYYVEQAMDEYEFNQVDNSLNSGHDPQLTYAEFQYFYPRKTGVEYHELLCAEKLPRYAYDLEEYQNSLRL